MAKASDSNRRAQRGAPKTIDLKADEVKPAPKPAEPVAFGRHGTPKSEPAPGDKPSSATTAGDNSNADKATPEKAMAEKLTPETNAAPKSDPKPQMAPKPAPKAEAGSSGMGGMGGMMTGAIAGAVVAALVAGAVVYSGIGGQSDGDASGRLAAMEQKIAGLEQKAGEVRTDEKLAAQVESLAGRLGQSEQALEKLQQTAPNTNSDDSQLSAVSSRMDELSSQISGLQAQIADLKAGGTGNGADPARVAALESRLAKLEESGNGLSQEISTLTGRLSTVEQTASEAAAQDKVVDQTTNAAVTIAVEALDAAYRRGEPFAKLLSSYEDLVGSSAATEALRPYADAGVATDAQLKQGFEDLAGPMLTAAEPPEKGVFNKLLSNAKSLVISRPAAPMEGDTPPAIVSRIEADLIAGDMAAALSEWQRLPEASRQVSQDWADRLQARAEADAALKKVLAEMPGQAE